MEMISGIRKFIREVEPKIYHGEKYGNGYKRHMVEVECLVCGTRSITPLNDFKRKPAKQCRCLYRKYGKKYKEVYNIYHGILTRCYNENHHSFHRYGGRGIKVCDSWLGDSGFHNFYRDMGDRPSKEHSIDRIDVNGDYCKDNCRWADHLTQARNKTTAIKFIPNKRYKMLTTIEEVEPKKRQKRYDRFDRYLRMVRVKCDCGNITEIHIGELGWVTSCGCLFNDLTKAPSVYYNPGDVIERYRIIEDLGMVTVGKYRRRMFRCFNSETKKEQDVRLDRLRSLDPEPEKNKYDYMDKERIRKYKDNIDLY